MDELERRVESIKHRIRLAQRRIATYGVFGSAASKTHQVRGIQDTEEETETKEISSRGTIPSSDIIRAGSIEQKTERRVRSREISAESESEKVDRELSEAIEKAMGAMDNEHSKKRKRK